MEMEKQLGEILAEVKATKAQAVEQEKKFGSMLEDTRQKLVDLQKQADALDIKLAEKHAPAVTHKSALEELANNEELKRWCADKPVRDLHITLNQKQCEALLGMERKTNVDSNAVGFSTSGVLPIDRTPGIVPEARQSLRIRDVLTSRPTQLSLIDYVKVNAAPSLASVQTESGTKQENAVTFNTGTARVQTVATTIPASRQVLDDMADLLAYLSTALPYYVNLREEAQFLTGSGTGTDLNGMVTQASAYNTALNTLTPGWKQQDIIGRAVEQIMIAKEIDPTFVVLHPQDFWNVRLTKDGFGRYLNSGPDADNPFWGLTPVVTTSLGQGTFLVGSGNPVAVEIRDRMDMTLEMSTQHASFFVSNQVMIRAEKRTTLVVYRPASFITGSLNTSP